MLLELLFCLSIVLYWFSEGVTEGWTWSTKKRKETNKLIHPNNHSNGIMDYHGWRIFENLGIWATVILAFLLDSSFSKFFWLGLGAWFIGTFSYEAALNYVNKGTIYKPVGYKWHIFGYDIPWWGGKRIYALPITGCLIILYAIIVH